MIITANVMIAGNDMSPDDASSIPMFIKLKCHVLLAQLQ